MYNGTFLCSFFSILEFFFFCWMNASSNIEFLCQFVFKFSYYQNKRNVKKEKKNSVQGFFDKFWMCRMGSEMIRFAPLVDVDN